MLIQNYYLYAERAASRQRVCLWLYAGTLRIAYGDEVLSTYPCTLEEAAKRLSERRAV